MLRDPGGPRWRHRLPAPFRSLAAGGFWDRQRLPQALVGQHQMLRRQGQPELCFKPGQLLANAMGLASQAPVMLAQRQMLSRHIAGVDGRAGGPRCQADGDRVGSDSF